MSAATTPGVAMSGGENGSDGGTAISAVTTAARNLIVLAVVTPRVVMKGGGGGDASGSSRGVAMSVVTASEVLRCQWQRQCHPDQCGHCRLWRADGTSGSDSRGRYEGMWGQS